MRNGLLAARICRGQKLQRISASLKLPICSQIHLQYASELNRTPMLPQTRPASSRSTVKLKPQPQGLLKSELPPLPPDDTPTYPTVIAQARDNMTRFSNCVLLTRVGGFYELYCEQAEIYGPLLGIKVAAKSTKDAGRVPMAGFPWMQLERYLKILVQDLGKYVAIAEEFEARTVEEQVRSGGNKNERRVCRVVTKGTLVDERWLEGGANNWCLSLWAEDALEVKRKTRDMKHAASRMKEQDESGTKPDDVRDEDREYQSDPQAAPREKLAADKLRLSNTSIGLAWVDLSTGEFFTQRTTLTDLSSLVSRVGPKEILLAEGMGDTLNGLIVNALGAEQSLVSWQPKESVKGTFEEWIPMLDSAVPPEFEKTFSPDEINAGSILLKYVQDRLLTSETKLRPPIRRLDTDNMIIDRDTMRGLEILETIRDSRAKGSLLHAVDRTVTNSGARLLRDRIVRPSTVQSVINDRLDLVEELLEKQELRKDLQSLLTQTFDTQRLVQKFALGRADADDLVSLSRSIQTMEKIAASLTSEDKTALSRARLRFSLDEASALSTRIATAIDEDGLIAAHEQEQDDTSDVISTAQQILSQGDLEDIQALGSVARAKTKAVPLPEKNEDTWIMRKSASPGLTELHDKLDELSEQKDELCEKLRNRTNLKGLTLQWQPSMGYICHLKGKGAKTIQVFLDAVPEANVVRGLKTTSSFYIPEWSSLGRKLDQTKSKIREEEQVVFRELRDEVIQNLLKLRRNAAVLDELDVACSSASLAHDQNAIRPIVDNSTALEIVAGRHPTVTLGLEERGRSFVSNDCFLNSQPASGSTVSTENPSSTTSPGGERMHLITGPNMAGKSTFLRQNTLLALLAQTGLFVPAAYARIGVVDALFARIGSADNLFSDQSTFMTEMLETAHILTHATYRSLVIMDEAGRGTTPEDGEAVAIGSLTCLVEDVGCRGLFATHFHGVVDEVERRGWNDGRVGMYCTDIKELAAKNQDAEGGFVFVHKVRPGVNRRSHALRIAAMAGLPKRAIEAAKGVLMQKEKEEP